MIQSSIPENKHTLSMYTHYPSLLSRLTLSSNHGLSRVLYISSRGLSPPNLDPTFHPPALFWTSRGARRAPALRPRIKHTNLLRALYRLFRPPTTLSHLLSSLRICTISLSIQGSSNKPIKPQLDTRRPQIDVALDFFPSLNPLSSFSIHCHSKAKILDYK